MSYKITPVFSTPFYQSKVSINQEVINCAKSTQWEKFPDGSGWVSKDASVLEKPEMALLKEDLLQHINTFIRDELSVSTDVDFYISNSWFTMHGLNHKARPHVHVNSIFSGTCYINIPDDDESVFNLHAKDDFRILPSVMYSDFENYNLYNANTWKVKPETGTLLIFSSQVEHSTSKMTSKSTRVCLAFNIHMRGTVGSGISKLKIG